MDIWWLVVFGFLPQNFERWQVPMNHYRPQTKLWKCNVFTPVCQSFCHGGVYPSMHWGRHPPAQCMLGYTPLCPMHVGIHTPSPGKHPLGRHPQADTPWANTPPPSTCWYTHSLPSACWDTPPPATAADSTHPTGMHSWSIVIL